MKKIILILIISSYSIVQAQPQPDETTVTAEPIDINQFSWLAGTWVGDGFGGVSEEFWSSPSSGSVFGSYKHHKEGKTTFYEFFVISQDSTGEYALKLKHFTPEMIGWETKEKFVSFPLISVTDTEIKFDGLSYIRDSENTIQSVLQLGGEAHVFNFQRKKE